MKKKTKKKLRGFFSKKKLFVISLIVFLSVVLFNLRDMIFCPYPAIVMQYKMRYNQMATDEYIGALRSWAYDNFDPISGLNYSQLLEWEHRHLEYWGGQLEVRPELPISILSTNLIGTVTMKNNFSLRLAIYCSQTETFTVYLNDGETVNDIATNSWYWWGYAIGRCGEFALLYNGLLLANGYQSRIVVDCSFQTDDRVTGDHVWNEIWINNTWIHIDPTEGIINDPTMYSNPERWNKNVNLVYAIQGNVITDVTEIYRWK